MKVLVLLLMLFAGLSVHAAGVWKDGPASLTLELNNLHGQPPQVSLLPIFGHKAFPDLELSRAVLDSGEFRDVLIRTVPRDEELIPFMRLTASELEADAAEAIEGAALSELRTLVSSSPKTEGRMKAWEIVNRNARQAMRLTLQVRTKYQPVDFEVVSSTGENSDRRASCVAGFRQTAEFEVVAIEFPGIKALTAAAQGVIGTVFSPSRTFFGPAVSFLEMKIDLGPEQGAEFARACKAERKL